MCECPHALSPRKFGPLFFIYRSPKVSRGAQKCAAHSLHRLHPRKDRPRPPIAIADPASIDRLEQGAHVSGDWYRVQAEAIYPSLELGLYSAEEAYRWSRCPSTGHPAVAMEDAE